MPDIVIIVIRIIVIVIVVVVVEDNVSRLRSARCYLLTLKLCTLS